jgi:hypothetical protein
MEEELFLLLKNHFHTRRDSERPLASKHSLSMFRHKPLTSPRGSCTVQEAWQLGKGRNYAVPTETSCNSPTIAIRMVINVSSPQTLNTTSTCMGVMVDNLSVD